MASPFTLTKSTFLGQTHIPTILPSTIPQLLLSTSLPKTIAKFKLYEIMGGRGLCNGEQGLQLELQKPVTHSPPSTPLEDQPKLESSTADITPENAFEKELLGLTGGFPGGEKGLRNFIEKNPPPETVTRGGGVSVCVSRTPPPAVGAARRYNADFSSAITCIIDDKNKFINPRRYDELPEDLWIQIFIRLPVKSLLLGKCVCKRWYVVINDPDFVLKHLQFQKTMSKSSGHFLLQHYHETAKVYNLFLFDAEFVNSATSSTLSSSPPCHNLLHFSLIEEYNQFEIDGPINGLYCLHNQKGCIVIWNPATSEVVFLPFPDDCIPLGMRGEQRWFERGVIGFGTDPLDEEDYKVVLISYCDCPMDDLDLYGFLYTTRTNTWRLIENDIVPTHPVRNSLNSTYLNGFYYWMGIYGCTVLVFDMSKKESFRNISTPCHGDLALHKDHITMFSVNRDLNEVDIWVMLEESSYWLKKISITGIQGSVMRSLGFWKTENEILIVIDECEKKPYHNTQTVLYNITTREIKNIGPRGRYNCFKDLVYYESLVSLSSGNGITKYNGNDRASLLDMLWSFLFVEWIYGEDN